MKAMSLTEVYYELSQCSKEAPVDRNKLAHLVNELDAAIAVNKQSWDQDNIEICLATLHRLEPTFQYDRCSDEHLFVLGDFLPLSKLSILLGVKVGTLDAKIRNARKRRKSTGLPDSGHQIDIESVRKMSSEEYDRALELEARMTQMLAVRSQGLPGVQVARDVLINRRNRQQREVENMWELCRDYLAWVTGDFVSAVMKKFASAKPPFDAKVLIAEALDDKYDDLKRKYQTVKPVEDQPWDEVVKKAKRRGKDKHTRKHQRKEERMSNLAGSTVPTRVENAGSPSNNVGTSTDSADSTQN